MALKRKWAQCSLAAQRTPIVTFFNGTGRINVVFYRSHPVVLSIQLVIYLRHTQQLTLKFTQLSATSF